MKKLRPPVTPKTGQKVTARKSTGPRRKSTPHKRESVSRSEMSTAEVSSLTYVHTNKNNCDLDVLL